MKANRRPLKRPNMRRAVILFPSGFTLGNLFFGIFAIIAASRLEFTTAGVYVMLGGICDALDGRVARATNSGTEFGEELDSLVDAITFGLAPGMIMYFAVLNRDGWDWIFVFLFAACAVLRLARFNIEQAGTAKTYFQGLPSPAAGITLASYYWFSQSWLYTYGAIGDLPWHRLLRFIMAALAMLMISNVPYPSFPRTGLRSIRSLGATFVVLGAIALLISRKLEYFFPLSLVYVSWGLIRWIFSGLFERRQPTVPYDLSEGEDDEDEEEFDVTASQVHASRPHRAIEPESKPERSRGRGDRPERGPRAEREPRAPKSDTTKAAEVADVSPERGERPQRTDAERAARREKRDKRDKQRAQREGKAERPPRPERTDRPAAAAGGDAIELAESAPSRGDEADAAGEDQVIGTIPGGAETEAAGAASGATRKRKRRRRRGARDRAEGATGSDGAGDGGSDDGDSGADDRDDRDESTESRSPYAAPSVIPVPEHPAPSAMPPAPFQSEPRPFTPPLPAPSPAPAPAAAPTPPYTDNNE